MQGFCVSFRPIRVPRGLSRMRNILLPRCVNTRTVSSVKVARPVGIHRSEMESLYGQCSGKYAQLGQRATCRCCICGTRGPYVSIGCAISCRSKSPLNVHGRFAGGCRALRKPRWLRGFKGRRIFERQSSESRSRDSFFSNPVATSCSRCRAQRRRFSILPRFPTLLRW